MIVEDYREARAFLNEYEKIMLEKEAVSQLVLYAAYHCCQEEAEKGCVFGAVKQEEELCLLFGNVLPYNLAVYMVKQDASTDEACAALAEYFAINRITVKGIIANHDICQYFIKHYKIHISCDFIKKLGMDIMEIRQVNEIKPAEGTQRLALPEEAKLAAQWMIEFQMEKLTSEMDYEAALSRSEKLIKEGKIFFYEDNEKQIVTMAAAARKLVRGTAITYVYTPEEFRGKGYAAANIYYLSKELLEQGNEYCTLFIDKKNPLSNRAYEKVGYQVIGENYEYNLVPVE